MEFNFSFLWDIPRINLIAAWVGIALGFLSGMGLGMGFQKEQFLGGYGSHRRRLYRLGHISFFGLAIINFMFWLTVKLEALSGYLIPSASLAFLLGALTMPLCCVLMAHWKQTQALFAIPVISLLYGAIVTLTQLMNN